MSDPNTTRIASLALAAMLLPAMALAQPATDYPGWKRLPESNEGMTIYVPCPQLNGTKLQCTPGNEPLDRSWHLLTQTHGGSVSLIRDLTKEECEKAKARIPIGIGPWLMVPNGSPAVYQGSPGAIRSAECFQ